MSYQRLYPQRINWEDEPSLATPINQVNLNKMDSALYGIDGRVVELDENKVGKNDTFDTTKNGVVPKPTQADITNEKVLRADGSWVEQTGGGGGGGGHTYVDKNDEQMPQRGKAKFTGGLNLTDDSNNNRTIVDDNYEIIPWATWQGYSDAEKAQHPNAIVTGAPDCDGTLEIENLKILWTNDNPSDSFPSGNITLNSDDYDILKVGYYLGGGYTFLKYEEFDKWNNGILDVSWASVGGFLNFTRQVSFISATSIGFGDALNSNSTSAGNTNNSFLVPVIIYGYKKKLTAKIKAIAHDVKATQDYSTEEHEIGTWIDGSKLYEKTIDCGALPNVSAKSVNHNISNIKEVVDIKGVFGDSATWFMINNANPSQLIAQIQVVVNTSYVLITTAANLSQYTQTWVTIQYTKTS